MNTYQPAIVCFALHSWREFWTFTYIWENQACEQYINQCVIDLWILTLIWTPNSTSPSTCSKYLYLVYKYDNYLQCPDVLSWGSWWKSFVICHNDSHMCLLQATEEVFNKWLLRSSFEVSICKRTLLWLELIALSKAAPESHSLQRISLTL